MSTFAYADPPYIGLAKSHYGDHPDYAGEVEHAALVAELETNYDGWALSSLSMKSLPTIARMVPLDVLTLSWVKPIAPPMGDHRHYSWEPVFMRPVRNPTEGYVHTHLVCSPPQFTFRPKPPEHVIGEKPEAFCHWLFECAGLTRDDEIHDLFPGSRAVTHAWATWTTKPEPIPNLFDQEAAS